MRDVAVIGVGMVRFQRYRDRSLVDFSREAILNALRDAEVPFESLQAAFCGARGDVGMGPGARVLRSIGNTGLPIMNIEAASATGGAVLWDAYHHVAGEFVDIALAFGVGRNSTPVGHLGGAEPLERLQTRAMGVLPAAGDWAMHLQRRQRETGRAEEACMRIAVKAHRNAAHNPYAHRNRPVTAEEVQSARMLCEPLTIYHCCPASDGAAAVIVASVSAARRLGARHLVVIAASEFITDLRSEERPRSTLVTRRAYEHAGLGPEDMDFVLPYDSFSMQELVQYEDLGFAKLGEGEKLILDGDSELGGRIPFATDGGNLARGHAVGPTGLAQVWEAVQQLRHQAGARQVSNAQVGLIHQVGYSGEALSHILRRA